MTSSTHARTITMSWRARLALGLLLAVAVATVLYTNQLLTNRFTETTRNSAELRQALNSGSLLAEVRQNAIVPQLLARDPALIGALNARDYALSTQRLLSFIEEIDAAGLMLLDEDGRVVASTDRNRIGARLNGARFFLDALRSTETVFTVADRETGGFSFTYSRRITAGTDIVGVIVVEVDLQKFERAWTGISAATMVTDSTGRIILTTAPRWRGLTEEEALAAEPPQTAIERAVRVTTEWNAVPADAVVQGEAVMRHERLIPFYGWRMVSFTTYDPVRERVNGMLALEIMAFALLLALSFYVLSRRSASRLALSTQEKAELRQLNMQLQREIAERKRVQEDLAVAEQSLEQSSKLAALGEMSAAVSHELNQPLAAMKTYLAGARLLLRRGRQEEAVVSFGRIDDLIERMGAITRQLKSYARKGQDALSPVNMGDALVSSLAMMEPQLRQRKVLINRVVPPEPMMVLGDRLRIEQVMVNLLRNAIDATKVVSSPQIDVILSAGETVTLTVRDNGPGVEDLDSLFEPFYTTKQPGDGVGLGLAISSGIVTDLGGRLTARNGQAGGAVFEMQLPTLEEQRKAQDKNGIAAAE
ncbi:MAG: ATP-binding protein [Pseudomonadota bacterium]